MSKLVVIGISGGVDSAVTAALLKNSGYDIYCVFLKMFDNEASYVAQIDAQQTAENFGVPFSVIDCRRDFEERVQKEFVQEYCVGRTPVPCINCNQFIKFKFLYEQADKIKADFVATGHYALVRNVNGNNVIYSARDNKRDQSFFLGRLTSNQIQRTLFPLGEFSKEEVRKIAEKLGIKIYKKASSQDICFLSEFNNDYVKFLEFYIKNNSLIEGAKALSVGNIIGVDGKVLGKHEGIVKYTIGQRRGLNVSSSEPLYVLHLKDNNVYLGKKDLLNVNEIILENLNFHKISESLEKEYWNEIKAQFRSTSPATEASVKFLGKVCKVIFKKMQCAISPGQICVIRNAEGALLLCGTIRSAYNNTENRLSFL